MGSVATQLARWAHRLRATDADLILAHRSLRDTIAVSLAARDHRVTDIASVLGEGGRLAATSCALGFDDIHLPSTTHISAVCVPAVITSGGDAVTYLAAAGVMARLGEALGARHYQCGWHTTCTAGAPAAAVARALTMGLDPDSTATAIALAISGGSAVRTTSATDSRALQVGMAVETGFRAAQLAAAGARADLRVVDQWVQMTGGDDRQLDVTGPAIPGGLAVKVYPCSYALQRPISVATTLRQSNSLLPEDVERVIARTCEAAVRPLMPGRPHTGQHAKYSLKYGIAAALHDPYQGFFTFSDLGVERPALQMLLDRVDIQISPGGTSFLDGVFSLEVHTRDGRILSAHDKYPPGSPQRPVSARLQDDKVADCIDGLELPSVDWSWTNALRVLRHVLDPPPIGSWR